VADVIILAENTAKVAVSEKDRPRPVMSNQRGFLAKVGECAGNHQFRPGPAIADPPLEAMSPTSPRAQKAGFEKPFQDPDSVSQLPRSIERKIRRVKDHPFPPVP